MEEEGLWEGVLWCWDGQAYIAVMGILGLWQAHGLFSSTEFCELCASWMMLKNCGEQQYAFYYLKDLIWDGFGREFNLGWFYKISSCFSAIAWWLHHPALLIADYCISCSLIGWMVEGVLYMKRVYRIKVNHEIIKDRQYNRCTVFTLFWLAERVGQMAEGLWLADGVGHKMCDRQSYWVTNGSKCLSCIRN